MDNMSSLADALPQIRIEMLLDEYEKCGVMPWFSFRSYIPERPLPSISERSPVRTERLIVRPLLNSDLDAFWELRQAETQVASRMRGRADPTKEHSRQQLQLFHEDDQNHWYFGAFLQSTGELIGEGGLPDCRDRNMSASGWPEGIYLNIYTLYIYFRGTNIFSAEFILKPDCCRQGYGTELFHAVMNLWWDLPREWQRLQLHHAVTPEKEPGDTVIEGVVFQWEAGNKAAPQFFAKMLKQNPIAASGGYASLDTRPGREGNVVYLTGMLVANPNQLN